MKKILAMVLSLALVATLAISGTVAYLTDDESEVNVMTVGKVDIELIEQQRDENKALEEFEQGKNLMPVNGSVQNDLKDKWGMPTDAVKNYVDKIVRVKNTGESPAWVRVFIGIPAMLEEGTDVNGSSSKNVLHWNVGNRFDATGTSKYSGTSPSDFVDSPYMKEFNGNDEFVGTQVIDGVEYNIYRYTREMPLEKGEITAAVFTGFYLDMNVDYNDEDGYYYMGSKDDINNRILDHNGNAYNFDEGIRIPVFAQAVQSEGFTTADEAFKATFPADHPWTDGTMSGANGVTTIVELKDTLSKAQPGDIVVLKNDIGDDTTVAVTDVTVPAGVSLIGNGNTMTNIRIYNPGDDAVIKGINFVANENFKHGANGSVGSFIYSGNGIGDLVVDGCSFTGVYWDAIQYIDAPAGSQLSVQNCVFNTNNTDFTQRHIHVEARTTDPAVDGNKVVLTNNQFNNITSCADDGITIYNIAADNIVATGNTSNNSNAQSEVWTALKNGTSITVNIF